MVRILEIKAQGSNKTQSNLLYINNVLQTVRFAVKRYSEDKG